jgi:hypothetical protein
MRRVTVVAGMFAIGVLAAACGGGDASTPAEAEAPAATTGGASSGGGSAVVDLGGTTYNYDENQACSFQGGNGNVIANFASGSDVVSITYSAGEGVMLLRLTVDGVGYSYSGPDAPEVSDNVATWTGEVNMVDSAETRESATVTITC